MSRTFKDRPYRLGEKRHRWLCVQRHYSHGKFTKLMRRLARAYLSREFRRDPDCAPKRSVYEHLYYD